MDTASIARRTLLFQKPRALLSHKTAFGSQESALLRCKALSCPRNLLCYATKHFSAPEIGLVTPQSTFLPQESALLRHKALFCPRNLHCYAAKHFSAPGICIVTPQSTFLPQESACLHHKTLSGLSHRAIQAGVAVFYRRQIKSPAPILEEGSRRGFPYAGIPFAD